METFWYRLTQVHLEMVVKPERGILCVTAQTRRVYEKKLLRLLRTDESGAGDDYDYDDDDDDDEMEVDDEDEESADDDVEGDEMLAA